MGVCIQCIEFDIGPVMDKVKSSGLNLAHNWVWVVLRRDPTVSTMTGTKDWHIQGVAADEELAVNMCQDETYLIGPLPLNSSLPHDKIEWIGSYFPLLRGNDDTI